MIPQSHGGRQRSPQNPYQSRPTSILLRFRGYQHAELSGGKLRLHMHGRHHFHTYPVAAIPVPIRALHLARQEDAATVNVTDVSTGRVYEAPVTLILRSGELCGCCPAGTMLLPLRAWRWINGPTAHTSSSSSSDEGGDHE